MTSGIYDDCVILAELNGPGINKSHQSKGMKVNKLLDSIKEVMDDAYCIYSICNKCNIEY